MRNGVYIVLISLITIGVVLLWDTRPELLNPLATPKSPFERFPYAVLHDAKTRHFDEAGILSYEFDAVTIKHFRADTDSSSDEDYMLITAPTLTLYGEPIPWHVTAKQGKVTKQGEELELWDDVRIWQATPESGSGSTELTTQTITIYPNEKKIHTEAHVHVSSPTGSLDADGLEVDMLKQHIKLLANVRGRHEPIE